jgi:hypothetical protein
MNSRGVLFLVFVGFGAVGWLMEALKTDPIPFNDAVVEHYAAVSEADANTWNSLELILQGEEFNQTDSEPADDHFRVRTSLWL